MPLTARFDFRDGPGHQVVHVAANLMIRLLHALAIEIRADFAKHPVVTALLKIDQDHVLGIGLGIRP